MSRPTASARAARRRCWLRVHLWLGLGLGLVFALLGLTGSALVFYPELDRLLNPALRVQHAGADQASRPSPDAIHARLRALHPERQGPWRIELPLNPATPIQARYYQPPETQGRLFAPLMLTLDPLTLDVTSQRFWGDYAVTWLYDLHYTLLLEGTGHNLVGALGLLLVASLISGLVLWWPSWRRLARALTPWPRAGMVRRTYDLHTLGGVYGWILLMVLSLTGAALAYPNVTKALVDQFSPLDAGLPAVDGLLEPGDHLLSLDRAAAIAQALLPGAELRWIETSGTQGRPISLRLHQLPEPGRRFAQTCVLLHPVSGALIAVQDAPRRPAGNRLLAWVHPLHNGEAFGLTGRLLAFLAGLLPTLLLVTGWLRWRHKRRASKGARQGARAGAVT